MPRVHGDVEQMSELYVIKKGNKYIQGTKDESKRWTTRVNAATFSDLRAAEGIARGFRGHVVRIK